MCGRRLAVKHFIYMATIAVGCSHVSGLLVQPFFTTAGPDVIREAGPDQFRAHGPILARRLTLRKPTIFALLHRSSARCHFRK